MSFVRYFVLATAIVASAVSAVGAAQFQLTSVTPETAAAVASNWLRLGQELGWGWQIDRGVLDAPPLDELRYEGERLGWAVLLTPGYIVIPACTELPPITAYSTTTGLNLADEGGPVLLLREALAYKSAVARAALSASTVTPELEPVLDQIARDRAQWQAYSGSYAEFTAALAQENGQNMLDEIPERGSVDEYGVMTVEPLLTTTWHQSSPYFNFNPMGDGGRTQVGCVATACSQILAFWGSPANGTGTHSYTWNGDNSCGGSTPSQTLSATYSDSYDWANMLNRYTGSETQIQKDAVAELNYEVAVALNTDFGRCASGAYTGSVAAILPQYFGYSSDIERRNRNAYTASAWFALLQEDLNIGWPMQYRIAAHSIVCDGWRISGGNQVHMNYGWADSHTAWYTVDALYCNWAGCDPMVEYVIRRIHPAGSGTPTPSVTVTTPNGGEDWTVGSTVNINWSSVGLSEDVRVELNRSYPSGSWEVLTAATANDGIHAWTVSGTVSTTAARVRILAVSTSGVGDTSNADFSITVPSAAWIVLTTPNGGESWALTTTQDITWSSANLDENVRIDLNRSYPTGLWETLALSTANDGSYPWTVAGTLSTAARIRVSGVTTPSVRDSSDANFVIAGAPRSITLLAPIGGEHHELDSPLVILWTSVNMTEHVRIELNRSFPAGTWETIANSTVNDGSYSWTVTGSATDDARIRISGTVNTSIRDTSDADFFISPPRILVVGHPAGGERLFVGDTCAVSWTSQFVTEPVRIELCRNYPAGPWQVLTDSTENTGSFYWLVDGVTTTRARVRITSLHDETVCDSSDADFTVAPPPPPPAVVIQAQPTGLRLNWTNTGAVSYRVYSAATPGGPFATLEAATPDTSFVVPDAADAMKFFTVQSSSTP